MKAEQFIKNVDQAQKAWGIMIPTCPIVIEMPNGERFEAVSGGVSQGPSFINEAGRLSWDTHFVLKPVIK